MITCPASLRLYRLFAKHVFVWTIVFSLVFPSIAPVFAQEAIPVIPIPQFSYPFDTTKTPANVSRAFGEGLSDASVSAELKEHEAQGHNGIDFDLPEATPILAVDTGEVRFAGEMEDFGKTVIIAHAWGESLYAHLSEIKVTQGQKDIGKGSEIALSGSTGKVTGPHLHFGLKPSLYDGNNGHYGFIDPSSYFSSVIPESIIQQATASASLDNILGANTQASISGKIEDKRGDPGYLYNYKYNFGNQTSVHFEHKKRSEPGFAVVDENSEDKLRFFLPQKGTPSAKVTDNVIEYPVIVSGIPMTLRYTLSENQVKEEFIIKEKPSDETFEKLQKNLEIPFTVEKEGLQVEAQKDGGYKFTVDGGEYWQLLPPNIKDAKAKDLQTKPIIGNLENDTYTLQVDKIYLENASYPVTIDPTVVINTSSTTTASQVSTQRHIATTSDGTLHNFIQVGSQTATCDGVSRSGLLWFNSTDSGATWTCQGQLSSDTTNLMYADVRVDSSDNIYTVYSQVTTTGGTTKDVFYRKLTKGSGATWTLETAQTVLDGTSTIGYHYATLEVEGSNRVWVAARYYDGTNYQVTVSYSNDLSAAPTWTVSQTTLETPGTNALTHIPTMVRFGSKIGIIYGINAGTALMWRYRSDGDSLTSWTNEAVALGGSVSTVFSAIGSSTGNVYLVINSGTVVIMTNYNGSTWSPNATVSSTAASSTFVSVTTDNTNVWVFYGDTSGLNGQLSGSRKLVYKKGIAPFTASDFDATATPVVSYHRTFDKYWSFVGGAYTDDTTDAASTTATDTQMVTSTNDIVYYGMSEVYDSLSWDLGTAGAGGIITWEYCSAVDVSTACTTWSSLTFTAQASANSSNFLGDGWGAFTAPAGWIAAKVNSESTAYYYVRARATNNYSATPVGTQMAAIPQINGIAVTGNIVSNATQVIWTENAVSPMRVRSAAITTTSTTPPSATAEISPTVAGYSAVTTASQASTQRHVVKTSDGTLHMFIQSAASSLSQQLACGGSTGSTNNTGLMWLYSTDSGSTWTCGGQISSDTTNLMYADARVDSSDNIYLVYSTALTTGGTAKDVFYRKLTKGSGAAWAIGNAQLVLDGDATVGYHYATLELEGTTRIWLATKYYDGAMYQVSTYYSDGLSDAPTWTVSQQTMDTVDNSATRHYPTMVRFGSKIGVIYNVPNTNDLEWRYRNDSDGLTTWAAEATIDINIDVAVPVYSAVGDSNGNIYLAANDSTAIEFTFYNGSSWQATLASVSTTATSETFVSLSIDNAATPNVYVLYGDTTDFNSGLTGNRELVYKKGVSPFATANFDTNPTPVVSFETTFDKVWIFASGAYTDETAEAASRDATGDTILPSSIGDIIYFGKTTKFDALSGALLTNGTVGQVAWEYWNGSTWMPIVDFVSATTPNFTNSPTISFIPHTDWATTNINGEGTSYYYIRARAYTAYSVAPVGRQMAATPQVSWGSLAANSQGMYGIWTENATNATKVRYATIQSFNTTPNAPSSLGPSNLVSGGYIASTQPAPNFTLSDNDGSDTLRYQIQIDDSSDFGSPVVDYTSALAAQGSRTFTVGQAAGGGTYATGSEGQTLSDGSYYWRVRATDNNGSTGSYSTANSGSIAFIVDTTGPTLPGSLASSDHTVSVWSANPIINTSWTASSDPAGIAGYSYVFDTTSGTIPDTIVDTTGTTATSTSLGTGNSYYFHVRAIDNSGNAGSTAEIGPFYIDVTGPTIPGAPTTATPTSVTTPTWTWTASTDVNVGISMTPYTVQWSEDQSFSTGVNSSTATTTSFTQPTALSGGIWYFRVQATDTLGNVSAWSANGMVVIATTSPNAVALQSPANGAFTKNPRPTFKWQAATTTTTGVALSGYSFQIEDGFTIGGIPLGSSNTTIETSKYVLVYEGFNDSDTGNNYISLYTKSSSDWSSGENDGKLKEGKRTWSVTATDTAGNAASSSRVLYADYIKPDLAAVRVGSIAEIDDALLVITTKPKISGIIMDNLAYHSIELVFEKKNYFLGLVTSTSTMVMTHTFENDANNTRLDFSFLTEKDIDYGNYTLTVYGLDKAGNKSDGVSFALNVLTENKAKELIARKDKDKLRDLKEESDTSITHLEKQAKVRVEMQEAELSKLLSSIEKGAENIFGFFEQFFSKQTAFLAKEGGKVALLLTSSIQSGTMSFSQAVQYLVNAVDAQVTRIALAVIDMGQRTGSAVTLLAQNAAAYITGALPQYAQSSMISFYDANKTFNDTFYLSEHHVQKSIIAQYQANGQALLNSITSLTISSSWGAKRLQDLSDSGRTSFARMTVELPQLPKIAFTLPVFNVHPITNSIESSWALIAAIQAPKLPPIPKFSPVSIDIPTTPKLSLSMPSVSLQPVVKPTSAAFDTVQENLNTTANTIGLFVGETVSLAGKNLQNQANNGGKAVDYGFTMARKQVDTSEDSVRKSIKDMYTHSAQQVANSAIAFQIASAYMIRPYNETLGFVDRTGLWLMTFNSIVLDPKPTHIADVTIEEKGKDYAIISWKTNHVSWGKVNYGADLSYGQEVLVEKRGIFHKVKLTGLKPGERYFFEVMSQGKNYTYDAYYSFETKK